MHLSSMTGDKNTAVVLSGPMYKRLATNYIYASTICYGGPCACKKYWMDLCHLYFVMNSHAEFVHCLPAAGSIVLLSTICHTRLRLVTTKQLDRVKIGAISTSIIGWMMLSFSSPDSWWWIMASWRKGSWYDRLVYSEFGGQAPLIMTRSMQVNHKTNEAGSIWWPQPCMYLKVCKNPEER